MAHDAVADVRIGDTITVTFFGVMDDDDVERTHTVTGFVVHVEDGWVQIGDPSIVGPQDLVDVDLDDPRTTIDRLTRATRSI